MKTPEGYQKEVICKYLDSLGERCYYFKPYTGGFGKSGVADLAGCIDGAFFSIEVKRDGKLPTKLQAIRMNEVRSAGGYATWGTAEKVISELDLWLRTRKV